MTKVTINSNIKPLEPVIHKIGNYYKFKGGKDIYILASVDKGKVNLINLNGTRFFMSALNDVSHKLLNGFTFIDEIEILTK